VVHTYTNNNLSSLKIPHARTHLRWRQVFTLNERFAGIQQPRGSGRRPDTPEDGFLVIIAQPSRRNAPNSQGAAVSRIALYEVLEPSTLSLDVTPPVGLPSRYLFWREEMSDGAISSLEPEERAVEEDTEWYRTQLDQMAFLGYNTFTKDLLEFGHNQGWDSASMGGPEWMNESKHPQRWKRVLDLISERGYYVLPYYAYAGSIGEQGWGSRKLSRPLGEGTDYTHIEWSEKANADVTHPSTLQDAIRILDGTIVRHHDRANFIGAWLRNRPGHLPVSFSEAALSRYTHSTGDRMTREQLTGDEELRQRYLIWWRSQRREFLMGLRDHLHTHVDTGLQVLYTAFGAEPGPPIDGFNQRIVTDDVAGWEQILREGAEEGVTPLAHVLATEQLLQSLLREPETWEHWEWQHAVPPPDPEGYKETEDVLMTYVFHRAYSVDQAAALEAFRAGSGLAIVRHYPLNEAAMEGQLGYFASDVDRAGAYSMLEEVRAVAHGDPRFIGYLVASRYTRGFPEYVRAFNAAFLALPAIPSVVLTGASQDDEIVVRRYDAGPGKPTYFAVAQTGLSPKGVVRLDLGLRGNVRDLVSGELIQASGRIIELDLGPCQLRALATQ
ncbi:MAG: hypothetical protein QGG05_15195, partial [Candidatus Latescibacteria bacterium]|nr:hypothetical protein [Candidatus Latescibacterota bacterium]